MQALSAGPGRGSEFIIRLPRRARGAATGTGAGAHAGLAMAERDESRDVAEGSSQAIGAVASVGGRRILVADDSDAVRDSLATLLHGLGNDVQGAQDGLQALEIAQRWQPDFVTEDGLRLVRVQDGNALPSMFRSERFSLVLLQHGLKDCDALQLCRSLRSDPTAIDRELPIVLVRTRESPAEQQAEAEAGVTDWLISPFSEEYARTRIRVWVLREACRWKSASLPGDEERRLRALQQSGILDTEAEERFDRFTRIAAALFEVPVSLVTLLDRNRLWFKSRIGLDASEADRDKAFCAHVILSNDLMQVPDAFADDRFADNPLVTGETRIRFYAGAPLSLGGGSPVGTLCVIDHRARNFDEGQLRLLTDLSKLAERELQKNPFAHV